LNHLHINIFQSWGLQQHRALVDHLYILRITRVQGHKKFASRPRPGLKDYITGKCDVPELQTAARLKVLEE